MQIIIGANLSLSWAHLGYRSFQIFAYLLNIIYDLYTKFYACQFLYKGIESLPQIKFSNPYIYAT